MKMKKMHRIKTGFLAMMFGLSMVMAMPVSVKAQVTPGDGTKATVLLTPCECGAELILRDEYVIGYRSTGDDTTHEVEIGHYYRCKFGHVKIISTTTTEGHSWNQSEYDDEGHRTYPGELFGEHAYRIKCTKCNGSRVVSVICHYPGTNSHNTPF